MGLASSQVDKQTWLQSPLMHMQCMDEGSLLIIATSLVVSVYTSLSVSPNPNDSFQNSSSSLMFFVFNPNLCYGQLTSRKIAATVLFMIVLCPPPNALKNKGDITVFSSLIILGSWWEFKPKQLLYNWCWPIPISSGNTSAREPLVACLCVARKLMI